MKLLNKLKNSLTIPPDYKKIFEKKNREYNNNAFLIVIIIEIVLLIAAITTFFVLKGANSYEVNGNILFCLFALTVAALIACVLMNVFKRSGEVFHKYINFVIIINYSLLMLAVMFISHETLAGGGALTVSGMLLGIFVLIFIFKFELKTTLSLITAYYVLFSGMIFFVAPKIDNELACFLILTSAYLAALVAELKIYASLISGYVGEKRIETLLITDYLTKVYNRRGLDNLLNKAFEEARRDKIFISFFLIDIDNFKIYNDLYGHIKGDDCLRAIAKAISASVRKGDIVARYGGEEFSVILMDTNENYAKKIGDRILQSVQNLKLRHEGSHHSVVTVSIGGVSMFAHNNITLEEFITLADKALYEAKNSGKNMLCQNNYIVNLNPDSRINAEDAKFY